MGEPPASVFGVLARGERATFTLSCLHTPRWPCGREQPPVRLQVPAPYHTKRSSSVRAGARDRGRRRDANGRVCELTASRSASSLNGFSASTCWRRRFSPRWPPPLVLLLGERAAERRVEASHIAPSPLSFARPERPNRAAETEFGDCDSRLALAWRSLRAPSSRRSFHVPDSLFHWFLHLRARAGKRERHGQNRSEGRGLSFTHALSVRPGNWRAMSAHLEPSSS